MNNKLQPLALGVAFGVLWAFSVFFAGLFAMYGWGTAMVAALGSFYLGYGASIAGAVIGALWAFVDGFVGGFIIAWIYNKVAK
jgi:hypothetical protein